MQLTDKEQMFIEKRKKMVRLWRYTGPLMLAAITGMILFIYITAPLLINPFETASRLASGEISDATLRVAAVLLPMTFGCICILLIALVGIMHLAFGNEKKYLALLEEREDA